MVWDPRPDSGSDNSTVESIRASMACVFLASTDDEAIVCRELLADYSIPAVLGTIARSRPEDGVPVLVPEDMLDQANDIIACLGVSDDPDEWSDEPVDDDEDDEDEDDDYDDDYDDDDDDDYDVDDDFEDDFDDE